MGHSIKRNSIGAHSLICAPTNTLHRHGTLLHCEEAGAHTGEGAADLFKLLGKKVSGRGKHHRQKPPQTPSCAPLRPHPTSMRPSCRILRACAHVEGSHVRAPILQDPRLRALAMRMLRPDPEDRPDVDVVLRQVRLLLQDLQGEERSPARHE